MRYEYYVRGFFDEKFTKVDKEMFIIFLKTLTEGITMGINAKREAVKKHTKIIGRKK